MTNETINQMLQWQLGLYQGDPTTLSREWEKLNKDDQWDLLSGVCDELAHGIKLCLVSRLLRNPLPKAYEWLQPFVDEFFTQVSKQPGLYFPKLSGNLNKVARSFLSRRVDPNATLPVAQTLHGVGPAIRPVAPTALPQSRPGTFATGPIPTPRTPTAGMTAPPLPPPLVPMPPPIPVPVVTSPTAAWKYIPVPVHGPEPHTEFDARQFTLPTAGYKSFAARVRGKKHKHDGTNCDDWFEVGTSGEWTIVAVADGAGSKKFSRIGAKVACQRAVEDLTNTLSGHQFAQRDGTTDWQAAITQDATYTHGGPDVEQVAEAVRAALGAAATAVQEAKTTRETQEEYSAELNRPLEVNDLSCTLLIAVHKLVQIEGRPCSFVAACQIGDGMIGVVQPNGAWHVLGVADSGGYSGETEFLTSESKIEAAALKPKTRVYLNPLQALLVMTDGVADDYFPPDEQLGRLWADLVVNAIPDLTPLPAEALLTALEKTNLPTPQDVEKSDYETAFDVVMESPRDVVTVRSAEAFADRLGIELPALLRASPLLWAGATLRGAGIPGASAAERLRLWLDSYHVRGSFDDRTLVVVHRETLP